MIRDYQQKAVDHILSRQNSALWLDCGLGKTLTTLTALDQLPLPALVIAPKRVITNSWPDEIAKWRPWLSVVNLSTTPKRREYLMRQEADIYLINYELLPWLAQYPWRWPTVIVDEASRVKSHQSKAFKVLKKAPYQRMVQLTGTPIPNGVVDIWSQIYLLDKGERLGKTITAFRERWMRPSYMGWGWEERPHAVDEVKSLCADIAISMNSDDYLTLPDKLVIDIPIELPPKARKVYETMKRDMVASIHDQELTALSAAAKATKLLQIAAGYVYNEAGDSVPVHTEKLDALDDIISGNTIIVYHFRSELAALRAKYPGAMDVREPGAIDKWNAGDLPILLINPACGHGLNLQHGGHNMIWLTPTYNLEHYQQTCARLHRSGQDHPVMIYRLLATDTIDPHVINVIEGKTTTQDALLSSLMADETKIPAGPLGG